MEDKQTLAGKEKAVSLPPPPPGMRCDAEATEGKRQNCLCAPTTHAGSFRCRLHRKPPPSVSSQLAAKRGFSAQRISTPKLKLALQHKLKQGCSKKMAASTCSTSSRLQQELPKLSRLSRASAASDQNQSSLPDHEALTTLWKASTTADSREEALESVKKAGTSDKREDLSPAEDTREDAELIVEWLSSRKKFTIPNVSQLLHRSRREAFWMDGVAVTLAGNELTRATDNLVCDQKLQQ